MATLKSPSFLEPVASCYNHNIRHYSGTKRSRAKFSSDYILMYYSHIASVCWPMILFRNSKCHTVPNSCGSSPRLRGTLYVGYKALRQDRFIPASAGNTVDIHREYIKPAVHPRVCGEHVEDRASTTEYVGSSPRLRGTLPVS